MLAHSTVTNNIMLTPLLEKINTSFRAYYHKSTPRASLSYSPLVNLAPTY